LNADSILQALQALLDYDRDPDLIPMSKSLKAANLGYLRHIIKIYCHILIKFHSRPIIIKRERGDAHRFFKKSDRDGKPGVINEVA